MKHTNDCGYIGGWSIDEDKNKEKVIDALNSVPEQYLVPAEEIAAAFKKVKERSRPVCTQCEFYDFNEMSDEAYCAAKDYEPILLYRKHRPDWCPRLEK